jgi:hypothetical protein
VAIVFQQRNVHDQLEIVIIIKTDIGIRSFWFDEIIALLPDAKGMRLDSGQMFKIFNRIV